MATKIYTNIELLTTPVSGKHLVNKAYVDAAVNRKLKDAVDVVATQNIEADYDATYKTLTQKADAIEPFVIDGVTLEVGNRVLLTGQTDATQNGIYTVAVLGDANNSTAGILSRAADFNTTEAIPLNVIIPVMRGDQNGDTNWQLINDTAVILDATSMSFAKFKDQAGANAFTATMTGDGVKKEFEIAHGLNTEAVNVSVVDAATKEVCHFGVEITSANVVTIKSDVVLDTTDSFIVTVLG